MCDKSIDQLLLLLRQAEMICESEEQVKDLRKTCIDALREQGIYVIIWDGEAYRLTFRQYGGCKQVAIKLYDLNNKVRAAATACLPKHQHLVQPGEVLIKNCAEIDGVLDALVAAGIVENTGKIIDTHFGVLGVSVCRLLVPLESEGRNGH